jgi:hypothetical protein
MSATKTGNVTHDTNCQIAESTRQVAVAAASTQSAVRSAEIAYYRTCKASALANGIQPTQFISALYELGQGGQ